MRVRFLTLAQEELDATVAYYHNISPNLSQAFRMEAREIRDLIPRNPNAWHPVDGPYRLRR